METAQILTELLNERARIDRIIKAIREAESDGQASVASVSKPANKTKKHVSEEARKKIAETQRQRWAKQKREKAEQQRPSAVPASSTEVIPPGLRSEEAV